MRQNCLGPHAKNQWNRTIFTIFYRFFTRAKIWRPTYNSWFWHLKLRLILLYTYKIDPEVDERLRLMFTFVEKSIRVVMAKAFAFIRCEFTKISLRFVIGRSNRPTTPQQQMVGRSHRPTTLLGLKQQYIDKYRLISQEI